MSQRAGASPSWWWSCIVQPDRGLYQSAAIPFKSMHQLVSDARRILRVLRDGTACGPTIVSTSRGCTVKGRAGDQGGAIERNDLRRPPIIPKTRSFRPSPFKSVTAQRRASSLIEIPLSIETSGSKFPFPLPRSSKLIPPFILPISR